MRLIRVLVISLAVTAAAAGGSSSALAQKTLTNGRITADLGGTTGSVTFANFDRMDSLSWVDSNGVSTGNVVRAGGGFCGDVLEFFGQSYGVREGTGFYLVVGGTQSKWVPGTNASLTGTSVGNGTNSCATQSGSAKTNYALSTLAGRVNALRVRRTFTFNQNAAGFQDDLRSYVPRFPWATVLAPDTAGVVQTYNVGCCSAATAVSDWNGKWFAADDGSGRGVAVIRDRSSTAPAYLTLDNDSISAANNSSIALRRPATGWAGTLVETQWLCFYDTKTWPAARRNAGKLPVGCGVPTP